MAKQSVLIVGAGMAGVAAGRELQEAGLAVTVLEARERIGGRTFTDQTLGLPIDLGASWIHGPVANPLTPLAAEFGVETGYTDFANESGRALQAFLPDGTAVPIAEYGNGRSLFFGALDHSYGSEIYPPAPEHSSLADVVAAGLPNVGQLSPAAKLGFDYAATVSSQMLDAADTSDISYALSGRYMTLDGGDELMFGGGFGKLVQGMAAKLTVELETVVEKIAVVGEKVVMQTSRGEKTADFALITLPLGVLKAGSVTFDPPLSEAKQAAIQRVGMGNYEKIGFRFPRAFWPQDPHVFHYVDLDPQSLFVSWINLGRYLEAPILLAHHAGSRARTVNQMSDGELVEQGMKVLSTMFGDDIPAPIEIVRTNWQADPFAGGSYSFDAVRSEAGDRASLAAAENGRLFFAGEATHTAYMATVHGAYESGIRAAREVVKIAS